ncbi:LysE family translocator [Rossellomorea marisflavi]|uniref:Lysine transporter LysE n=1 Tax=Rossellomorea marisflavi TaxID=189381 RepID=A0A163LR65_9BACI|nr:LysE family transporter [Rossellomorea marisflavi]KZE50741.1 lysine transporter LysE [Rossellomorea marisflavi]QHA35434.1 LysE family transporter [Rossellomorea marisflavi]TYO71351.1 LysE family translocator [Rossellomorea marisflavi]
MDFIFLLKGLLIGFTVAAPVGPIGILCINRTLSKGRLTGFVSGLGAASADAIYGCIAAFGLTFITSFLISQKLWLQLIGGLFLCYLGIQTYRSRPAGHAASARGGGLLKSYTSVFFLTVTNPMTILFFIGIFSGIGLGKSSFDLMSALLMVTGVFLGSAAWWLSLSFGVSLFRKKFSNDSLAWINRLSGIIVFGFGVFALLKLL